MPVTVSVIFPLRAIAVRMDFISDLDQCIITEMVRYESCGLIILAYDRVHINNFSGIRIYIIYTNIWRIPAFRYRNSNKHGCVDFCFFSVCIFKMNV